MLKTVLTLIALISISPAVFACDGKDEFVGKEAALAASEGPLTCISGKTSSQATVQISAIYKCLNSPVRGELTAFGQTSAIGQARQLSPNIFEFETRASAGATITCVLNTREVPVEDLNKARTAATFLYEQIVGMAGSRNLEVAMSSVVKEQSARTSSIIFHATMDRHDSRSKTPYMIRVRVIGGNVTQVMLSQLAE